MVGEYEGAGRWVLFLGGCIPGRVQSWVRDGEGVRARLRPAPLRPHLPGRRAARPARVTSDSDEPTAWPTMAENEVTAPRGTKFERTARSCGGVCRANIRKRGEGMNASAGWTNNGELALTAFGGPGLSRPMSVSTQMLISG